MSDVRSEAAQRISPKAATTTKVPQIAQRRPSIAHICGKRTKKRTQVSVSGLSHWTARTRLQATTW